MAFRTFVDSAGQEWQVYDVTPLPYERRHYDRRASRRAELEPDPVEPLDAAQDTTLDRRDDDDRRLTVGRQSALVPVREGWLCFESGEDRRRLSPIPEGWSTRPDAELEQYRDSAREVRRRPSRTPPAAPEPKR